MSFVAQHDGGGALPRLRSLSFSQWGTFAAVAFAVLLFCLETLSLRGVQGSDFGIFHDMVQRVLNDPAGIYLDPRGTAETARSLQGFLYPPPSFFLLLPFGGPSAEVGFQILSWGSVLAVLISLRLWATLITDAHIAAIPRLQWIAIALLLLVTGPVFTNRLGQIDAIILLVVSLGVTLCWRNRSGWGAAVLAFGSWVKIYPALLLIPILVRRKWRLRALGGFVAGAIIVPAAAMVLFPLAVWKVFFFEMLPVMSDHVIVNIYNQSLSAILTRLSSPMIAQSLQTYDSVAIATWIRLVVPMVGVVLLIVPFAAGAGRASRLPVMLASSCAIIGLIAPLGWGHSYVYVLPLMLLVMANSLSTKSYLQLGIIALAWLALLPPAYTQLRALSDWPVFWHLFYARYAIATSAVLLMGWKIVLQPEAADLPR